MYFLQTRIHTFEIVPYRSQQNLDSEEEGHYKGMTVEGNNEVLAANFRVHTFLAFTHFRHHSRTSTDLSMQEKL